MCLFRVDSKINKKALKYEGKYVICWKLVLMQRKRYYPQYYYDRAFKNGWNLSTREKPIYSFYTQDYIPHFHAYISELSAKRAKGRWLSCHVIKCKTDLKYITATGSEHGRRVLVTSKIWIPPYKE